VGVKAQDRSVAIDPVRGGRRWLPASMGTT